MREKGSAEGARLNEGQLTDVAGGRFRDQQEEVRYRCPKCGGPVRYSSWLRYHCEACDESWCYESDLLRNP